MKQFIKNSLLLLIALTMSLPSLFSQVSSGGQPMSTLIGLNTDFRMKVMEPVDNEQLKAEDYQRGNNDGKPVRYGTVLNVDLNLNNSGTWTTLADGSRIWRLGIKSSMANSINLFYKDFYLPQGGLFFLYNADKSMVLGSFTNLNNAQDGYFATAPVIGDYIILEYYEPVNMKGKGRINVSEVVHAYKDIFGILSLDELPCNININCPIGAPWVEQKRSVTRITFTQGGNGYLCTGSLVNNTLQDRKLYYLTAEHCAPDNHSSMVFYFNYESPTCSGTGGPLNQTVSGATLKSANYDTDFRLVELNGTLPASYNAFFNGWDKSNAQSTEQTAIHHPDGANKKISIDTNDAITSNGFGGRLPGGFWLVVWDYGMTEGGSSGCPLYDQNKRVIGQNLGGTQSQCQNPQAVLKYFGKFSSSWNHGGSASNQLKDWLDPNNSGVNTIDGIDAVQGSAPIANFTSSIQALPIGGGSVNFIDLTTNFPTTWSWSFPGGNPSSSNVQNPTNIQYTATGAYTVTLTVTNQFGSNTRTFVNYVTVAGVPMNTFNLISPPSFSSITVSNSDTSKSYFTWTRSSNNSTVKYLIKFKKLGGSQTEYSFSSDNGGLDSVISLKKKSLDSIATLMGFTGDSVRCSWRIGSTNGLDTLYSSSTYVLTLRSTTIGITPISNIVPETFVLFNNYPNPFNPKTNITFDIPKSQFVKMRVYDMQGREVALLVSQNLTAGRYSVDFDGANLASGVYFYSLETQDYYKVNKMVLVK